jgi:hypothetical protein
VVAGLEERGFLVAPAGLAPEVLRLGPPLVVGREDLEAFADALSEVLRERASGVAGAVRGAAGEALGRLARLGGAKKRGPAE